MVKTAMFVLECLMHGQKLVLFALECRFHSIGQRQGLWYRLLNCELRIWFKHFARSYCIVWIQSLQVIFTLRASFQVRCVEIGTTLRLHKATSVHINHSPCQRSGLKKRVNCMSVRRRGSRGSPNVTPRIWK